MSPPIKKKKESIIITVMRESNFVTKMDREKYIANLFLISPGLTHALSVLLPTDFRDKKTQRCSSLAMLFIPPVPTAYPLVTPLLTGLSFFYPIFSQSKPIDSFLFLLFLFLFCLLLYSFPFSTFYYLFEKKKRGEERDERHSFNFLCILHVL